MQTKILAVNQIFPIFFERQIRHMENSLQELAGECEGQTTSKKCVGEV